MFAAHLLAAEPEVPRSAALRFEPVPGVRMDFQGFVGERIDATVDHWLLRAPGANPGMLEMFRVRDREPAPQLVPWAGEFIGKYLISAIQTLQLSARPELRQQVADAIAQLIASQADDGYLGPFRKAERLRGNWDLWGHYHALLALLMWHDATGDAAAMACARRAADLICATYLDTGRRVLDAGSDEMNLAVIHGLGRLYRATGEPRYRRMMAEIEKDWERAGDYFRAGLNGLEFYQSPRPRWESLHDLQGLVELYRSTGDARYRESFEHHWRSIARCDLRNTGGFSSGEQATGNPYAPTAIETCCSIAWMAISVDMLSLTGDPGVADVLEVATLNAWAGAQHPSGRWCTYNTPMDGVREASAHSIVFQSRAGTPELNCCSVNGPRGWGLLAEWAVMRAPDGLVLNWLGPVVAKASLPDGSGVVLRSAGDYPWQPVSSLVVEPEREQEFALRVRVPGWAVGATAALNDSPLEPPAAGSYLTLKRVWRNGDRLTLQFPSTVRAVPGAQEARGCVSLYRGPILLAWDQRQHEFDENQLPPVNLGRLDAARAIPAARQDGPEWRARLEPRLVVEVPSVEGPLLRLCDFASAGASGTRYRSWLRSAPSLPAPAVTRTPRDGARLAPGKVVFRWTRPGRGGGGGGERASVRIAGSGDPNPAVIELSDVDGFQALVEVDRRFESGRWYEWEVVTVNAAGCTHAPGPRARFQVDHTLPAVLEALDVPPPVGPRGERVSARLRGEPAAQFGRWQSSSGWRTAAGPDGGANGAVALDGAGEKLVYTLGDWPEDDYAVAIRFRVRELPSGRLGQVFSAWCASMDDPLRLVIDRGRLFARIEAGGVSSTDGVAIEAGRWYHAAAVKAAGRLTLFVDGQERASAPAPALLASRAVDGALGGNPHFSGNEFLAVDLAEFAFYARALERAEIERMAGPVTK